MAMNLLHQRRCSSVGWADMVRDELLPWALAGVELGDQTLEIGPGYGATLRALVERARVIHGDGSNTGLPDTSFASVVCFTMLHHVPTDRLQDQLFAEAFRVLRPGGMFAGSDRLPSLPFRLIHIGDTYNPIRPDELKTRLGLAGFTDIRTDVAGVRLRWRASKPGWAARQLA
jgi:SAM-dependent methyltransferase